MPAVLEALREPAVTNPELLPAGRACSGMQRSLQRAVWHADTAAEAVMKRPVLRLAAAVVAFGPACGGKVQRDLDGRGILRYALGAFDPGRLAMSRISASAAIAAMIGGLPVACGSTEDDQDAAAVDAGTLGTGGSLVGQLDAGAAGAAAALPMCDNLEGLATDQCPVQVVLPNGGAGGAAGDPGAAGAAGAASDALCTIPLELDELNPNQVNLAVDCEVIPYCDPDLDATIECWEYDNVASPTAIELSEALCARITEEGFTRIDIMTGCSGPRVDD
jgi:hypothetical protein